MLEVRVRKRLGEFVVDAEFAAERTGVTALFGRSGAGKTSVVNMIAGLVRPESGRIRVGERLLFDSEQGIDLRPERRRIGYVFQDDRLFPHLTVAGNLLYGRRFAPRAERYLEFERIVELLGVGALLKRRPATLSGGEKQRIAIGRALLSSPRILLMDEPLAGLDAERRSEILRYIERLRDELGVPIVYVSHSLQEVSRLAETLVLLSDGRVAAVGSVEQLMGRLDLRPLTGRHQAGAVLEMQVEAHDTAYGLTILSFPGGTLRVPRVDRAPGSQVRVRIPARDVSIATSEPRDLSILNIFKGRIVEIGEPFGAAVDLKLDVGVPLWARITARSLAELDLVVGKTVYALVKSVAIDRHSLGLLEPPRRDD